MLSSSTRARRSRLRIALIAVTTLLIGLLGAQSAGAAIVGPEPLLLGQQTVISATTGGDTYVYSVTVPAGQRLRLQAAPSADPVVTNAVVLVSPGGFLIGAPFGNDPDAAVPTLLDVPTAPSDRTVQVRLSIMTPGVLPFTADLISDLGPTPLVWGTPATASIAEPGQQARYTITGIPGHRLGLTIDQSTFTGVRVSVSGPNMVEHPLSNGAISTSWIMLAGTYTLRIDPTGVATGSIRLRAEDVQDVTADVTLPSTQTVDLSTVWTQSVTTFPQQPGARLRFDLLENGLRHADGTVGALSAATTGTSGGQIDLDLITAPTTQVLANDMTTTAPATLTITGDGLSTGTVTFRLSAQPDNPAVPATLGQPVPVDLGTAYNSRSYTIDGAAARYAISVTDVRLTSATGTPSLFIGAKPPTSPPDALGTTSGADVSAVLVSHGTPWTILLDPAEDTVGSVTLLIAPIEDVVAPLTMDASTSARVNAPADTIRFTYPGSAGAAAPSITVDGVALQRADGTAAGASLTFEQNGMCCSAVYPVRVEDVGLTFPAAPGLDPTRPWQLVARVDGGAQGTVAVGLHTATTTRLTARSGVTERVALTTYGDTTEITVNPAVGQHVLIERANPTTAFLTEVRDVNGWNVYYGTGTDPIELPTATSTDPYVIVTRLAPENPHVGTLDVTVHLVTDPAPVRLDGATRLSWNRAENPSATFVGQKGRRVTVRLTDGTWGPDVQGVFLMMEGPNGWMLGLSNVTGTPAFAAAEVTLPETGTYTLRLDPQGPSAGSVTVRVAQVNDLQRQATVGVPLPLALTQPGQRAMVGVKVKEGQELGWKVTSAFPGYITLYTPEGWWFASDSLESGSGVFPTGPLPAGTYYVEVDPTGDTVVTTRLTLTATTAESR